MGHYTVRMCLEYGNQKEKYGNTDDLINTLLDRAQFCILSILCMTSTVSRFSNK
jgi:hypothetical protein